MLKKMDKIKVYENKTSRNLPTYRVIRMHDTKTNEDYYFESIGSLTYNLSILPDGDNINVNSVRNQASVSSRSGVPIRYRQYEICYVVVEGDKIDWV